MRSRWILWCVLVTVAAVPLSGCEAITKAITPPAIIKHVTVQAKVGQPGAKVEGTLKSGAPSDLPLWEGASVLKSSVVKSKLGKSWSAILATPDAYDDVVKGMAVGFQRTGWQVQSQDVSSTEGSTTVLAVTGPSAAGMVTIAAEKDKTTQISYVISPS
jgi:hypothetical protein